MFDYDEIEEVDPAEVQPVAKTKTSPLNPGETPGPAGFAKRAESDFLRLIFPLRHLVLLEEFKPPRPPGVLCSSQRRAGVVPQRAVFCFGPPSARVADWAGADAFGSLGTEDHGNVLVHVANRSRDELHLFEYPPSTENMSLKSLASKVARHVCGHPGPWAGIGVGVGCWLLVAVINALRQVGGQAAEMAERCEQLHMVGFPPPDSGLSFERPEGTEDVDWQLAATIGSPCEFSVPQCISVYHFVKSAVLSRDQLFRWFNFQPSLQDGATKGAYPFFGVQGDLGVLREPRRRTELFWALANSTWGCGPSLAEQAVPFSNEDMVMVFWEAARVLGQGPVRPDGLFDEANDAVLLELKANPDMVPFTNYQGDPPILWPSENYCAGNAGAQSGLDIRMYADRASADSGETKIGRRTVCAVRFGNAAGISVFPGTTLGVHGGAIQAAMDEITAICCRCWVTLACTTRKIVHQIPRPVYQFQTYKAVCEIEEFKNDGAVVVVKAKLLDLAGEAVCISRSEMLDFNSMAYLQRAS